MHPDNQRDGTAMYRRSVYWVQSGEWKRKMIGAVGTDRDPASTRVFFLFHFNYAENDLSCSNG